MTKKRKPGRPEGIPRPGSGKHPDDKPWLQNGYVTIAQAAKRIGVSAQFVYRRIHTGLLVAGVDYRKVGDERTSPVYLTKSAVEALRRERLERVTPPKAVA